MWWFLPTYGMIPPLDPRADMALDTRAPQHGRHSLRVTVPSLQPMVFPFSPAQDSATERGVGAYELPGPIYMFTIVVQSALGVQP